MEHLRVKRERASKCSPLQLVEEVVESGDALFEAFAFAGFQHNLSRLGGFVQRIATLDLPMVEHALKRGKKKMEFMKLSHCGLKLDENDEFVL